MTAPITIAIGPRLPEFGSWLWLGEGLSKGIGTPFVVEQFTALDYPTAADITIFVKFKPSSNCLREISRRTRLIYIAVDSCVTSTVIVPPNTLTIH